MTLLLDTHALIWLVHTPERLSPAATEAIGAADENVLASHVSLWEMAIKRGLGKLDAIDRPAHAWFERYVQSSGLRSMSITAAHLGALESLEPHHRDPFDRLLVTQARTAQASLVTADDKIRQYEVETLW